MPTPETGTGPGWSSPLPAGGTAVQSTAITAIEQQFAAAVRTAEEQYRNALGQQRAAQGALDALPAGPVSDLGSDQAAYNERKKIAQTALDKASDNLQQAANTLARIQEARANAYQKGTYATPEERDLATARAEDARAQAELSRARAGVATATSDAEVQRAQSGALEAQANAALTTAKLGVFQATTPEQIASARLAVDQAQATVEATRTNTRRAGAEADIARAQANVAPVAAQTGIEQAQANVSRTQVEIEALQRQLRQAPSDEQARQAIQLQIQQKQAELQAAQQQLNAAQTLLPIQAEQGQANVEATRAGTAATEQNTEAVREKLLQAKQGPLYGLDDQIAKYRQLIQSGQMSADDAQGALHEWMVKQSTGASIYDRQLESNRFNQAQRNQDLGFAQSMANTASNFLTSGIGHINQLASTFAPGQGEAYAGEMQNLREELWNRIIPQFAPPPQVQNAVPTSPTINISLGPAPAQAAAPIGPTLPSTGNFAAPAPAPAPAPGGQVPAGIPDSMRPATPDDVLALWGRGGVGGRVGQKF